MSGVGRVQTWLCHAAAVRVGPAWMRALGSMPGCERNSVANSASDMQPSRPSRRAAWMLAGYGSPRKSTNVSLHQEPRGSSCRPLLSRVPNMLLVMHT